MTEDGMIIFKYSFDTILRMCGSRIKNIIFLILSCLVGLPIYFWQWVHLPLILNMLDSLLINLKESYTISYVYSTIILPHLGHLKPKILLIVTYIQITGYQVYKWLPVYMWNSLALSNEKRKILKIFTC